MTALEFIQYNSTVLRSLEKGDLVEFPRGLYNHWAVYAGDGKVIHLTGDVNSGSKYSSYEKTFNEACVKHEDFWNVTGNSKAKKNNFLDGKNSPYEAEEIVERALEHLGIYGYDVLLSNCEHFATFCRYGIKTSEQADILKYTLITMAVVFGAYLLYKSLKKKETKNTDK